MDKCDFFLRYTGLDEFSADILIDIEGSIVLRCAEVAEQQLGQLIRLSFFINPKHIPHTGVELAVGVIRQKRIHQPLIQSQLSAVRCDFQHVIDRWVYHTGMHSRRPFRKLCYHRLLMLRRLHYHSFKPCLRHRQMQLIGSLDIRHFLEHVHQLRQVEELCKSCSCPISGSFRCQLDSRGGLTKGRSPTVEMGQSFLL